MFPSLVGPRWSTHGRCWPVRQDWFLTLSVGGPHTSDSLTGNWFLSNHIVWAHVGNSQQQMRITLKNEDEFRNMTSFYSTSVRWLVYSSSVLPNIWAEKSVCTRWLLTLPLPPYPQTSKHIPACRSGLSFNLVACTQYCKSLINLVHKTFLHAGKISFHVDNDFLFIWFLSSALFSPFFHAPQMIASY